MIQPVMIADETLSYKNKKEYEKDVQVFKVNFKTFMNTKFEPINEKTLIDFATQSNSLMDSLQIMVTYLFVQYHSDTRKTYLMKEAEPLLEMSDQINLKIDAISELIVSFGEKEIFDIIIKNPVLSLWKEFFAKLMRKQVGTLTPEQHIQKGKYMKEFTKMDLDAQELGNKPIENHFKFKGKKYTEDETTSVAIDPTTDRELRKQIFIHSYEDKRKNKNLVEKSISTYANKRIEYLKKFGYSSYQQFIGSKRDETKMFAKEIMETSKNIYKEIYSKCVQPLNEYRKKQFNLNKIEPWDEVSYPTKIIPIPLEEIITFYQKEVKDIFPKESRYIIDNFSKKGTLAILESEHKFNGAAATWTAKNDIYYVTQSYVDSIPYSASTLVHEMGHTMHIVAAKLQKTQIKDARFSLAIGEGVADTFSMLFAFASMDKKAKYAKTIAYEALARLLQVTNTFASRTLAEDQLYEDAWKGKDVTPTAIQNAVYKKTLEFKPDGKTITVDGIDLIKKGATLGYFSIGDHYTYSSYTISFIMAIYLADQIRNGNNKTFIKILNMGSEEYSTNHVLEMVGIDINSQEIKDIVIKTAKEITDYIINE